MVANKLLISFLVFLTFSYGVVSEESWNKLSKYYYLSKISTNDASIKFNLAMTYAFTGYIEQGFKEIASIPGIDPTFKDKALIKYKRKTTLSPNDWEGHFYYAFALYVNEQKDSAISEFNKVIELASDDSIKGWSYGYIAYIYGERKQWPLAMENISKAVVLEPEGAALYLALGIAKKETGDGVGAAASILKAGTLQAKQMLGKHSLNNLKNDASTSEPTPHK